MPLDHIGAVPAHLVGAQRIFVGDCLEVLPALPAAFVDAVVTSPPYNIGVSYRSYDDRRPRADYIAWLTEVGRALSRVMKDDASFFLNVGAANADPWLAMDAAGAFRDLFVLQNQIAWVKSISVGDDTIGHFKPITSRRYLNQNHETVFHFTKTGAVEIDRLGVGVPFKHKSNIARWGHAHDKRCAGNVWLIPYKTVRSKTQKFDHPAGFPLALAERCLRLHGGQGVVLDPFAGAGTSLAAAEALGWSGVGIELDPAYAQAAATRLTGTGPAPQ